jgi:uncharacterized protein
VARARRPRRQSTVGHGNRVLLAGHRLAPRLTDEWGVSRWSARFLIQDAPRPCEAGRAGCSAGGGPVPARRRSGDVREAKDAVTAGTDSSGTVRLLSATSSPSASDGRASAARRCDTAGMQLADELTLDDTLLRAFCRRHGIRALQLFGSAARNELRDDSDIDLLVEFEPDRTPGLLGIATLELQLEQLLGRNVDLRTAGDLSPYFRGEVVATARVLYAA